MQMKADALQGTAILDAVKTIDACMHCDVLRLLSASQANEWVQECRVGRAAIPARHTMEFIHENLALVYGADKVFGLLNVNGRQCCQSCFKNAYGFDKSVFSDAKTCVEAGETCGSRKDETVFVKGRGITKLQPRVSLQDGEVCYGK